MDDALRYPLVVEARDLVAEDEVLEQRPPRRPLTELWLSLTGTPWFVVSPRPPESVRTRSRDPLPGFSPGAARVPTFAEATDSVSVLPVTTGSGGACGWPASGRAAARPYSLFFRGLNGV